MPPDPDVEGLGVAGGQKGHLAPDKGGQLWFSVSQSLPELETNNGVQPGNKGHRKQSAHKLKFDIAAGLVVPADHNLLGRWGPDIKC